MRLLKQSLFCFVVAITTFEIIFTEIPPTGLNLLEYDRKQREDKSIKKIKRIVTQNSRQKKRKSKKKIPKQKNIKNTNCKLEKKKDSIFLLNRILNETYLLPSLSQKKITLHLKKIDVRQAIALVAKMSDITCVVDTNVCGKIIDMRLDDVSVGEALQLLLESNSPRLALIKSCDVWRVVTIPVAEEILQEKVALLENQQYSQKTVTLFHARWDDSLKRRIEHLWHGIIGKKNTEDGSYIMFDDACKKIFFRAKNTYADDFLKCLNEVDQPIAQIKIDARVIIANKDFDENFGIQWSGVYNRRASAKNFKFLGFGPITSGDQSSPDYTASHNLVSDLIGWSLNFLPTKTVTQSGLTIPFVFGNKDMSTKRLNLLLNVAETREEIKTILKPSLLVNSEECAEILVGEQLPQETRVDESIEGKLTNVTTTQYKDVGMKISVKPVASPDQSSIFLDVYVENSSVVKPSIDNSQNPNSRGLFGYTIETSRSKNRVLLKSGQTTLISGLIVKMEDRIKTGIPYLQEIPILGTLFRGSRKHLVDKQILIFITPTIV